MAKQNVADVVKSIVQDLLDEPTVLYDFIENRLTYTEARGKILATGDLNTAIELQAIDAIEAGRLLTDERLGNYQFDVLWVGFPESRPAFHSVTGGGSDTVGSVLKRILDTSDFQNVRVHYVGATEKQPDGIEQFYRDLLQLSSTGKYADTEFKNVRIFDSREAVCSLPAFEVDIIFLYDDPGQPGLAVEIQKQIERTSPALPCVIVSERIDYSSIRSSFDMGTEYFLPADQWLSSFRVYFDHLEKTGSIVRRIKDFQFQKHVMDTLTYWNRKRDYLWFGDKCFHMINHRYEHIKDDWYLMNRMVEVVTGDLGTDNDEEVFTDTDLYSLTMACWLHDIGHRGNRRYSEAFRIRDVHGLLSGEFIVQNPQLLDLKEPASFAERSEKTPPRHRFDSYYEDMVFPLPPGRRHLPQTIRERNRTSLTALEKVAIMAMYHSSRAPIDYDEMVQLHVKNKEIADEFYTSVPRSEWEVVTVQSILDARLNGAHDDRDYRQLPRLISLLRLVDGLDLRISRVGDSTEGKLKKKVIQQDLENLLRLLEHEVRLIMSRDDDPERALILWKELYDEPRQKLLDRQFSFSTEYQRLIDELYGPQPDYWKILKYAWFVSVQDGHFELHSSVEEIEIESEQSDHGPRLVVRYVLNRTLSEMLSSTVSEVHVEPMTLWDKIFGNDKKRIAGYAIREIQKTQTYLAEWLNLANGVKLEVTYPYVITDGSGDAAQKHDKAVESVTRSNDTNVSHARMGNDTHGTRYKFSRIVAFDDIGR